MRKAIDVLGVLSAPLQTVQEWTITITISLSDTDAVHAETQSGIGDCLPGSKGSAEVGDRDCKSNQ